MFWVAPLSTYSTKLNKNEQQNIFKPNNLFELKMEMIQTDSKSPLIDNVETPISPDSLLNETM